MDINTAVSLIGSLGFPIVMCLIMVYFYKDLMTKVLEAISNMNKAISDNTNVIEKLIDKIGEETNDD